MLLIPAIGQNLMTCSIPDCERKVNARGWCFLHYRRWWTHGDPLVVLKPDPFIRTPEFTAWECMMGRCYRPGNASYHRYGGRGITVCARWHTFANFLADVGKCPVDKHSLDRINNDGNYEPENVRWATRKEQMRNTRSNRTITLGERTLCMAEWAEVSGTSIRTIAKRLLRGWKPQEAIFGR